MVKILENAEMIRQQAQLFDELRPDDGGRIFLLKHTPDKSAFTVIIEITSGWFVAYNKYREQTGFQFATTEASFADYFAAHSHVGYGVPNSDDEIDVFEIKEERDKIPPTSSQPSWKCFGVRAGSERFLIT